MDREETSHITRYLEGTKHDILTLGDKIIELKNDPSNIENLFVVMSMI